MTQIININLEGFLPSEFKSNKYYVDIFEKCNLSISRLISGSKSFYREKYPDHEVYFNANIIIESKGKIWYGDLDLTIDENKLQEVANILKEPLYVLREMDARFENENKPFEFFKEKAVKVINPSNI